MQETQTITSVTDILCQLISIPSVNPMGRDLTGEMYLEEKLSDYLVEFFQAIGAQYERIEVAPGRANIVAKYEAPDSELTLLIDAHQDTVPVEGMTIPAFEPSVAAGKITGRGACDVKGGLAAALFAFRRLVTEKPAGAASVILSCTCDEEATTIGITDLVKCWQANSPRSKLMQSPPDAAIIIEPTELDLVIAHKGVTRFRIHVSGRACHSSEPTQGVSAIYKMARVVTVLEEYANSLSQTIPAHELCGGATLSIGLINGGSSVNIVPDSCTIEIDRRMIPGETVETVLEGIKNVIASNVDFEVNYETPYIACSALSNHNNAWLGAALLDCVREVNQTHNVLGVPYCTHASQVSAAGVPSIVFGPGSIEQAHTKDEFIEIDQLEKAAEIYYQLCTNPPDKSWQ